MSDAGRQTLDVGQRMSDVGCYLPGSVQSAGVSMVTSPATSPCKIAAQLNQFPPMKSQPRYMELTTLEYSVIFQMFR